MKKVILDLCGGTGAWGLPYKQNGYEVINLTLPDYDVTKWQEYADIVRLISEKKVYGILAAPPCTMFSDARTNAKTPRDLIGGMGTVKACLEIVWECQSKTVSDQQKYPPLKFWALENPWYGRLKWFLGQPNYIFNPWEFGDNYKKKTALWGYFNDPVKIYQDVNVVMSKEDLDRSKTNSRKLPKFDKLLMKDLTELKTITALPTWKNTKTRQMLRGITPQGFANALPELPNLGFSSGNGNSIVIFFFLAKNQK